jgi:hypothetical protein
MILATAYGLFLTLWHRRLLFYLYREHRTTCEKLEPLLFNRHGLPDWVLWGSWFWPGIRFFLFKKYETLQDAEFRHRSRRFRFALGMWLVMLVILTTVALYLNPQ